MNKRNEVIDKHGGVTLECGAYVPAISEVDLWIILGCPFLILLLIPLCFYLTKGF